MGVLIAKRYPTKLFANLADHTYVECGTGGRAWSCWGGKTGGTEFRRATGSTQRADDIAGTNEKAGITCYLVNGVCHQAANRILLAANITVRGARGYEVSEALFGTYGRDAGILGFCNAPFDQHPSSAGDLAECRPIVGAQARAHRRVASSRAPSLQSTVRERRYLRGVLARYAKRPKASARSARAGTAARVEATRNLEAFHVDLFMYQVDFKLRSNVNRRLKDRLASIRRSTERSRIQLEERFTNRHISPREFVKEFDAETVVFQLAAGGAMTPAQYRRLFELEPGEIVTLADPRIVKRAFERQ